MPISLRDLAPFITPYVTPNERIETTARALQGLNAANQTVLQNKRIDQEARSDAATLAANKAQDAIANKYNQDKLAEEQRNHTAQIEHDRKTLEEQRFKNGMELYGSMIKDMGPDGNSSEGRLKMEALKRYGFGFVPEQPQQPPPAIAQPSPPMSPQMAQAMPHVAGLLSSPAHQQPQMPAPQAPSPAQALPPAQGQPTPGSAPPQQPAPQPQMPAPQMAQAPAPPMPQPQQPQVPQRWAVTFMGKPVDMFDPAAIAARDAARTEQALAPMLQSLTPQEQVFARSMMASAGATGMSPETALTFTRKAILERQQMAAELAQQERQAKTAEDRQRFAEARQAYVEQRDSTRNRLAEKRMELQLLRDQARDASSQKRLDQQIKMHSRSADRMESTSARMGVRDLMKGRGADKTADSVDLLNQAIKDYWAHPNEPKYYKAAAYSIAKARDEGKLSDADVAAVPEITGWLAEARKWKDGKFLGKIDDVEYRSLGGLLETMRDATVLHSHEHYQDLATLRDAEEPGSAAYRAIDKILVATYSGKPWWEAERKKEGLATSVSPEPKEETTGEDEPVDDLAPLDETIPTSTTPQDEDVVVPRTEPAEPPAPDINGILDAAAAEHGIDPALLRAMAQQESGGQANITSPAGAQGLMQLMPPTAKELGVTNPMDPTQSAYGGAQYMAQLLKRYNGDVEKALQAYNGGMGRLESGKPMPQESQDYSRSIMGKLGKTVPASEAAPDPKERQAFRQWVSEFKAKNGRKPTKAEAEAFLGGG